MALVQQPGKKGHTPLNYGTPDNFTEHTLAAALKDAIPSALKQVKA